MVRLAFDKVISPDEGERNFAGHAVPCASRQAVLLVDYFRDSHTCDAHGSAATISERYVAIPFSIVP